MKQLYKLEQLKDLSYFDKNSLSLLTDLSGNTLNSNVKRWLKRELLVKLKNGIYTTGEFLKQNSNQNTLQVLNQIYQRLLKTKILLMLMYTIIKKHILMQRKKYFIECVFVSRLIQFP